MIKLYEKIRKFKTIFSHPSIGKNARIFRLAWNALPYYLYRNGRAFYPLNVYFVVNNVCNLNCKMCDVGTKNKNGSFARNLGYAQENFLTNEKIKAVVDEVSAFKPAIGFTSTEPLLRKDITDLVKYTLEKGLEVLVTTNGYLLENFAKEFVDIGLTRLCISIDGPRETHNRIRGKDDAFQRATRGLQLVKEAKKKKGSANPRVLISCTITNYNYSTLCEFVEAIKDMGADQINFQLSQFITKEMAEVHNREWGDKYPATETCVGEGVDSSKIDLDILYEQILIIKKKYPHLCVFLFDIDKKKLKTYFQDYLTFTNNVKCVFPWFLAQVKTTGELIGLTRCYSVILGDLKKSSFREAWNGEKMRSFRKDLKRAGRFPGCSRCEGILYR